MPNPFWNREERRLRAFWRLAIFLVFFLLVIVLAQILLITIGTFLYPLFVGPLPSFANSQDFLEFSQSLGNAFPWLSSTNNILGTLALLGLLWLMGKWIDRRSFADFGFHFTRAWWLDCFFGVILGGVLMLLIFLAELAFGWLQVSAFAAKGGNNFPLYWFNGFIAFIAVAFREEILSRGVQLREMAEGFNFKRFGPRNALILSLILSSLTFGALHLANPGASWISTANIAIAGFLLAAGYVLTGELAIPIGLHLGWNFFQGNVFGFPVSGTEAGATLIAIRQGGPELITGGDFGPEAGLVGLVAMLIGILLIVGYVRWRHGKIAWMVDLANYKK